MSYRAVPERAWSQWVFLHHLPGFPQPPAPRPHPGGGHPRPPTGPRHQGDGQRDARECPGPTEEDITSRSRTALLASLTAAVTATLLTDDPAAPGPQPDLAHTASVGLALSGPTAPLAVPPVAPPGTYTPPPAPLLRAVPVAAPPRPAATATLTTIRKTKTKMKPPTPAVAGKPELAQRRVAAHRQVGKHRPRAVRTPRSQTRAARPVTVLARGNAQRVVNFALAQVGDPYRWAASGPDAWDCSGLVRGAYRQVGVGLPHKAAAIGGLGRRVARSQARPGDVVAWGGHVGIYLGGNQVVHAPQAGERVQVDTVWGRPWFVRLLR